MEVFNTLMMIFIGLVLMNVILTLSLWHSTRSNLFGMLAIHWSSTMITFYIQKNLAVHATPLIHALGIIVLNYFVHVTLNMVYARLMGFSLSFKKFLPAPFVAAACILLLYFLKAPSTYLFLPTAVVHSMIYYTTVWKGVRMNRRTMTFSQKGISLLMVIFATHLYTYAFFQGKLDLLIIGFAVALALLTGISILFPAAIIEQLSKENQRLINEMEMKAKLAHSAKMVAIGEMAEGIAHEINNPLMIMSIMLDKARFSVEDGDYQSLKGQLDRAQKSSKRMSRIVKGLLEFSSEDEKEDFTLITAQTLIERTLELCSEKIKKHYIDLNIEMPDRSLNFIGQKSQLSQAILGLINNAFDAVEPSDKKWIKIELQDLGEKIRIAVSDSGSGFSEDAKARMFQPFFTTKEVGKGTGLGLSIAHGVIERHKGEILLESESSPTTVSLIIPKFQFVKT